MYNNDRVASWNVPLRTQIHKIDFEHGTTTGKRVIRVDGVEILRRDWMFKLVGKEVFKFGTTINVEAIGNFAYEYSLTVNGKTYNKFKEEQNKKLQSWEMTIYGHDWRIVLDKDSMEIWANGNIIKKEAEFVDNGTETHFELGTTRCRIVTISSGNRK
ncbi:hypothetical protein GCK72_023055 [Caenorhabditis remanei]|uniref:Uncharacterized protein n=1 Tax=Caenorhabditis remanei TaxID=31234 RepID=A0A6A5FVF8_CAERE|nr:hypothetical protein GCK72_023055 [Caenorhabditis remanei]KAF1746598.1 hypothetical protein GCK72_023055 [Caenorhabditis remanei]